MAYGTLPWPAVSGSPSYSADQWKNMLKSVPGAGARLANSGVLPASNGMLRVYASNPATMVVHVEPGFALINGLFAYSDAVVDKTVDNADPTYARIDRIVFRSTSTGKSASIEYRKGTAGPTPTPPALVQDGAPYYDIPLAQIDVAAGATSLAQTKIRPDCIWANAGPGEIQLCRAKGAVHYGYNVWWAAQTYPTVDPASLDGYYFHYVSETAATLWDISAGVALADAADGALVPVLTRGFWLGSKVGVSNTMNTFDLVLPGSENSVAAVRGGGQLMRPYGIALQWKRTGGSEQAPLATYIDPIAFATLPQVKVGRLSKSGNLTNNVTGSWSDVTGLSAQLYTRTRLVEIMVNLACSSNAAGQRTKFTISVDGTDWAEVLWDEAAPVANYRQMCTFKVVIDLSGLVTPMNATHTFQARWQPSAGTSTIYNTAGEVVAELWVKELLAISNS